MLDAHVHVWSDDVAAYPFGPHDGLPAPVEAFTAARLTAAMDAAGVTQALAIQPRIYGYDHAYLLDAANSLGERLRVMPLINVVRPANADEAEALAAHRAVAGFRVIAQGREPASWLVGSAAGRLWARLTKRGLPVGLLISPEQLPTVETLAEREPDLRIVIDHFGGIGIGAWPRWGPVLLRLARLANINVKVSALGHLSLRPFPYEDMHGPVRNLVECYGPGRLLWGSDWPHACAYGAYQESASAVVAALGLDGAERDRVLAGTARSLFGFGVRAIG